MLVDNLCITSLKAIFVGNPVRGAGPLFVQFTDQSTGDIVSWAWSFGDGAISTEQNPMHVYTAPGLYDVALTVSDGDYTYVPPPPPSLPPPPPYDPPPDESLQAVIDAAQAGSIVDLTGGHFAGDARITKALTLVGGSNNGDIVVAASGVHLQGLEVFSGRRGIEFQGGNAGLQDFSVIGCHIHDTTDGSLCSGIRVLSGSQGIIQGNTIERIGVGQPQGTNAYGIVLEAISNGIDPQCHDIEVDDNDVANVPTWHAIDTHGGYDLRITSNRIAGSCAGIWLVPNGLSSSGGPQRDPHNIVVDGNVISGPPTSGCNSKAPVFAWFLHDSQIINNQYTGWGGNSYTPPGYRNYGDCSGVTASGNVAT